MPSQSTGQSAPIAERVGANIAAARAGAGLTQRQLADRVGVESGTVSRWERGDHRPHDAQLVVLAAQLDRDVLWFYGDHAPAAPSEPGS